MASLYIRPINSLFLNTYKSPPAIYASYSSTQTQNITQNLVLPLVYNTEDISASGIRCTLPSANIYILESGVYKVLARLQCDRAAGAPIINMYPSINGVAVPNSATRVLINPNLETLMTVEWYLNILQGQYITIDTFSTSTGTRALAVGASSPVPLIPSIITTIMKIS